MSSLHEILRQFTKFLYTSRLSDSLPQKKDFYKLRTEFINSYNKEVSSKNIQLAQEWIDNLLLNNLDAVENSMHEEFTFIYMGITENENGAYGKGGISYGKNEFLLDYWPVVGELLPNGIILKTLD